MTQAMSFHLNEWFLLARKIKIHPLFWFVLGIGIITGYFREVLMVFMIVFIHELGHAVAASYFKWKINKIELLPFGGVAEVEDNGNKPFREELMIILAGPIQHVWMIGLSFSFAGSSFWSEQAHQLFLNHNLVILLFNLLPILPLDGGRLLQLLCCYRSPYKTGMATARKLSFFILIACMIIVSFFFSFHLNIWVVFSFLILNNYLEWKQRHYRFVRFLMGRNAFVPKRPIKTIRVDDTMIIKDVMDLFERGVTHQLVVSSQSNEAPIYVPESMLLRAFLGNYSKIRLKEWLDSTEQNDFRMIKI
ncbi:M50 family metallopeptidase [Alkalihalobacillus alcalophilus]|uniref:M50 family metallopeptidase n=1 Tax=Alkalihalobacillus alcalophilus TaxID=1445 RepID=UPI00027BC1FB|nr:M50 family metallopeptidase [Alkalihalobacillus alcalophilus]MED1561371.1 M50 family metallopeptidase [Alkalihalobacillus alcalophilus]